MHGAALTDVGVSVLTSAGPWAVVVMALIVFAETGILVGFFLPGDSMLFAAGVLVTTGVIEVPLLVVVAVVAVSAFLGDQLGYFLGRRFGPRVLNRPGSRLLSPAHVARAEEFFARHGAQAVIFARFLPYARTFVPVLAGVGTMTRSRFVFYNVVGAVFWAGSLIVAGGLLGEVDLIADHIDIVCVILVAMSMTPVVIAAVRARRRVAPEDPVPTVRV